MSSLRTHASGNTPLSIIAFTSKVSLQPQLVALTIGPLHQSIQAYAMSKENCTMIWTLPQKKVTAVTNNLALFPFVNERGLLTA
jgi:hypothetical protein